MNTLKIEKKLSEKYGYKKLNSELSIKYRNFFKENIPDFLKINGENIPLYNVLRMKISNSYDRIVIGDYGAFIEIDEKDMIKENIKIKEGKEYRIYDTRYSNNVKYFWYTTKDNSNIKIYYQRRKVNYADYKIDKYYVSVHEVFVGV